MPRQHWNPVLCTPGLCYLLYMPNHEDVLFPCYVDGNGTYTQTAIELAGTMMMEFQ